MYTIDTFFHSTLWFSSGVILNRIKFIILSILVLRLGITHLAIFYVSIYLVNELSSFANRLVSSSYNRFLRDKAFTSDKKELFALINSVLQLSLILGLVNAVVVFFLAHPLAYFMKDASFIKTMQLLSMAVPFIVITNQIVIMLSVLTHYKMAVILHNILEAVLMLTFAYLAIFVLGSDVYTSLVWQVFAIILSASIALLLLHKVFSTFRINVKPAAISVKTSPVIIFNALAIMLLSHADILIIGFYFGAMTLGAYIATLVGPRLIYTIAMSGFGMFIHTADAFYQDREKVTAFSQKVMELILIFASALTIMLLLYPQETLSNIIRIHVAVDSLTVRVLSMAFFLRVFAWMAGQVLIIRKHSVENMRVNVLLTIMTFLFLLIAAPGYGFLGLAFALLTLSFLELSAKTFLAYTKSKIYFLSNKAFKILLIGIFFSITNGFIIRLDFGLFLFFFPIAFFLTLYIFQCIDKNDLLLLRGKLQGNIDNSNDM